MPATEDVIRELHDSSVALLGALRERSPLFLEHLERRERAVLALTAHPVTIGDRPRLQAALHAGEAASLEAQHMRQESLRSLNSLEFRRSFSRGLSAGVGRPSPALDVKA